MMAMASGSQVVFVTVYTLLIIGGVGTMMASPDLKPEEWAAWVQAVGSILAVLATGVVVYWQETRRREDIRIARLKMRTDQLESLVAMARLLRDAVQEAEWTPLYFGLRYRPDVFTDLKAAFAVTLVHDARSATVAQALMALRRESVRAQEYLHWENSRITATGAGIFGQQALGAQFKAAFDPIVRAVTDAHDVLEARRARAWSKLPERERI